MCPVFLFFKLLLLIALFNYTFYLHRLEKADIHKVDTSVILGKPGIFTYKYNTNYCTHNIFIGNALYFSDL